jgi:glycosyltransferase involved in cell wall biosynthesis
MIQLTVIIPMYNVEKYIHKCIYSVVQNNLKSDDFEIIIVDDESPDNSLSIATEIAKEFDNITIISQKNKGLGGARNTGILNAKGKYLLFLDSDDFYTPNSIETIVKIASDNELEILEFGAIVVDSNNKIINTIAISTENKIFDGIYYWQNFNSINSACNKLYLKEFLILNSILFKEKIYAEDYEFNTRALYFAKKVMATKYVVANFLTSNNSITRNKTNNTKEKYRDDLITILEHIKKFESNNPTNTTFFKERISLLNIDLFILMLKNNFSFKEISKTKKELKEKNIFHLDFKIRNFKKNILRIILRRFF